MKVIYTFLTLLFSLAGFAQEQNVVSSSGGQYFFSTGSMTWTVGEVIINTVESPDNKLTQGFNQTNINIVGITEYIHKIKISVFPNPTTDFINIESTKKTTLKIYDLSQKLILEKALNKKEKVDLSQLSSGTYFLAFYKNNKRVKTVKIIIQK